MASALNRGVAAATLVAANEGTGDQGCRRDRRRRGVDGCRAAGLGRPRRLRLPITTTALESSRSRSETEIAEASCSSDAFRSGGPREVLLASGLPTQRSGPSTVGPKQKSEASPSGRWHDLPLRCRLLSVGKPRCRIGLRGTFSEQALAEEALWGRLKMWLEDYEMRPHSGDSGFQIL